MIVIPAIDLKEGKCVRLEQGLMDRDTVFSDDPVAQALAWQRQGAELLHLVDLDGAFAGEPKNRAAIEAIVRAVIIPTQLGGGIRDLATIEAYLALGIGRVIIGTAAQRNPELVREACARFPGRIVVGIDAKDGLVAVQGWAELTNVTAVELARKFEGYGVAAVVYLLRILDPLGLDLDAVQRAIDDRLAWGDWGENAPETANGKDLP